MEPKNIQILNISLDLFTEYGTRSVSMAEIARNCSMSRATLYQYYPSKKELIQKMFNHSLKLYKRLRKEIQKKNYNAIDVLIEVSYYVHKSLEKYNPMLQYDLAKYHTEDFNDFINKKLEFLQEDIKSNLEQGMQENLYRDDLNASIITEIYMQRLSDIHRKNFQMKSTLSFQDIFILMFENHIRGIANAKGVLYFEERKKTIDFLNK